jgi:Trk K+ transport system NAD-binding subunit
MESPSLPQRNDKFLVLGGGMIGGTIVAELDATLRRAVVIEPSPEKLEKMRKRFGEQRVEYVEGDALFREFDVDEFDGVSVCTPVDEKNFAIGLDFIGHDLVRVIRAVDEDMEFHYRRMCATPVFVGRVGSGRMLREVTNQFANRVLQDMLTQNFRLDQVQIKDGCTPSALAADFEVIPIALCRESQCYFAPESAEPLQSGDTLIFCGHVESNRKLRMAHLLDRD